MAHESDPRYESRITCNRCGRSVQRIDSNGVTCGHCQWATPDVNGTEWCEAGEGATGCDLGRAVSGYRDYYGLLYDEAAAAWERAYQFYQRATNLKLTGRPLTSTDLERIARCEVK